jgi:hypothetical protein
MIALLVVCGYLLVGFGFATWLCWGDRGADLADFLFPLAFWPLVGVVAPLAAYVLWLGDR